MYSITIKTGIVEDEYLYYFPNSRKIKIFERTGLDISEGSQVDLTKIYITNLQKDKRKNMKSIVKYGIQSLICDKCVLNFKMVRFTCSR